MERTARGRREPGAMKVSQSSTWWRRKHREEQRTEKEVRETHIAVVSIPNRKESSRKSVRPYKGQSKARTLQRESRKKRELRTVKN